MGDVVKGQLSAEMLILITVVLAIVAIAASQMLSSAKGAAEQIEEQGSALEESTSAAMICGNSCSDDGDCSEPCSECRNGFCS